MNRGDLTDAADWDEIWSRPRKRGLVSALRRRMRWQQALDATVCALVDLAGPDPADILEVGCAPGDLLTRIHRLRPQHRLAGIDIAHDSIELARGRLRDAGVDAELFAGDVRTCSLPVRYDAVLSFGLIEHFEDPTEIVRAHARLARTGGHVGVTVPNYAAPAVRRLLARFSPETLETHNLELMAPEKLAEIFERAGLVDVEAGTASGPVLPSSMARQSLTGRAYRLAARVWNLGTSLVPGSERLWQGIVWAKGRV